MKYTLLVLFTLLGLAACQPSSPDTNDEVSIEFFRPTEGEASLEKGGSIALSWKALGTNECSIEALDDEDSEAQSVACEGEGTYSPQVTTTYRFSALQEGAEAVTQDLEIVVVTDPVPEGVSIEYFRVEDGDTQIAVGESVRLAWKALNATDCQLEAIPTSDEADEPQTVDCDDDATFSPETTTTYRFSASQAEGETVALELTINVFSPEPVQSVILTFTAVDAQDYILESVEGEDGVAENGAKDPVLTLTVGNRYRIVNRVNDSHPLEFLAQGGVPGEDEVLFSQLDGVGNETFTEDPEVDFVEREDGFSFTLTRELAGELDGYRCAFHPSSMRANVETKP